MSKGDEHPLGSESPAKLQVQLSLLADYACMGEVAYDDMYIEDNWKKAKFRRYRQASGLSPINFLRQYNLILELQQLSRAGEEETRLEESLVARRSLQAYAVDMQSALLLELEQEVDAWTVKEKCDQVLQWLKMNPVAEKEECQQQQTDLENAYQAVFKMRFKN